MNNYIDNRIENMIYSKIQFQKSQIKHYFTNRHNGFRGVEEDEMRSVVLGEIKTLRVWREIESRNNFYSKYNKYEVK